jgi:SAM-dependent methyltransferase
MINIFDEIRVRWYDLIHNVETRSKVPLAGLDVVGNNKSLGHWYVCTLPKSMQSLLRHLKAIDSSTTFIDIGCGKGLTLLVAATHPFRKIIGVEFSPQLHQIALQNIQRYRGSKRCTNVEVLCMDAADFQFPAGPLLVYFFNPFDKPIMEKVLSNLAASFLRDQREITVISDSWYNGDLMAQILRPGKTEKVLGFFIFSQLHPASSYAVSPGIESRAQEEN